MIKLLTIILVAMISLSTACSPIEESSKTGKEENQSESRIEEIDGVQMLLDAKAKLEALDGFYTVTEGATVSVGISQSILAKRIVSEGAVFKQSVSYSFMIKTASQTLAKDGKYFLYVNGGEESKYNKENITRMSKEKANEWLENNK